MPEQRADAFAGVLGTGRGSAGERHTQSEATDLDRVRELLPLVGAVLAGEDIIGCVTALRRRAHELGVEVVHGVFTGGEDTDDECGLTVLRSAGTERLIGVVELDGDGDAQLLRPDRTRWTP